MLDIKSCVHCCQQQIDKCRLNLLIFSLWALPLHICYGKRHHKRVDLKHVL